MIFARAGCQDARRIAIIPAGPIVRAYQLRTALVDYRVDLEVYQGPLDLLLYLIKRDELDIYDIPIARITDSYLAYVKMLRSTQAQSLDINVAGEFVVMAATLMEIKSAMLLPRHELADTGGPENATDAAAALADPRYELVQKLLEYKRIKDSAALLDARRIEHSQRFIRQPARPDLPADEPPPIDLDEVQIWDLLDSFTRLMREVGARGPDLHEVIYDDTPIDLHAADIEDRLRRDGPIGFRNLLMGRTRSEMIGLFLALLELIRQRRVIIRHAPDGTFSPNVDALQIEIAIATPEPAAPADATPMHLADPPAGTVASPPATTAGAPVPVQSSQED
jgi:segregation and condensation protein A